MKVQQYGCFVALDSRTQALVHVSELALGRVGDPSTLFQEGDRMDVKVLDKNQKGQLRLSRYIPTSLNSRLPWHLRQQCKKMCN